MDLWSVLTSGITPQAILPARELLYVNEVIRIGNTASKADRTNLGAIEDVLLDVPYELLPTKTSVVIQKIWSPSKIVIVPPMANTIHWHNFWTIDHVKQRMPCVHEHDDSRVFRIEITTLISTVTRSFTPLVHRH